MLLHSPTLSLLFCGQALYRSCSLIGITLTSLTGVQLMPLNSLATLPLALLMLGNLSAMQPSSRLMQRHGRRPGLMPDAGSDVLGGPICAAGVWTDDFLWFYLGALGIGVYQTLTMYYRFAALEVMDAGRKDRTSAYVLAGGVFVTLLAPNLALWLRNALAQPFVGAYLLIAVLVLAGLLLMVLLHEGQASRPARLTWRDIGGLLRRPMVRAVIACTAAEHGLVILTMNATPLAMGFCDLPLERLSRVIQWHVLGMFLPALFAGALVDRIGNCRVALLGAFLFTANAGVALGGQSVMYLLLSLLALDSGWNLMLIAGTILLSRGHTESERGVARGLMEQGSSSMAALMSFGSGALVASLGWNAVNLLVWSALLVVPALLRPVR